MKLSEVGDVSRKNDILLLKISEKDNAYYEIGIFIKRRNIIFSNVPLHTGYIQDNNFYLRRKNKIIG